MANVLDNLAADIYKAADVVGRELVGFIPSATINANGSERAAKGDNVRASFTRAATAVNVAESMTIRLIARHWSSARLALCKSLTPVRTCAT